MLAAVPAGFDAGGVEEGTGSSLSAMHLGCPKALGRAEGGRDGQTTSQDGVAKALD